MNRFFVGSIGNDVVVLKPPTDMRMSPADAQALAAWLVMVAHTFEGQELFDEVLKREMSE